MNALFLALCLLGASPVHADSPIEPAQDTVTADDIVAGVGFEPIDAPVTDIPALDDRTHKLAKVLRCPVCQGLSVADSSSEAAVAMKGRIRDLIAAGYTEEQIKDYFIGRYGTWVLLDPPAEGVNWLIFVGPVLLLLAGFGAVSVVLGKRRPAPTPAPAPAAPSHADPYVERILSELED